MSDEGKLREQQARGDRAKALLSNELLQEAFDAIDETLQKEWRGSRAGEQQLREDVWRSQKLLENIRKHIEKHVYTGEAAGKELTRIKGKPTLQKVLRNG